MSQVISYAGETALPALQVLVATSAAEEGIDVQSCHWVARFAVAESGRERVQVLTFET